MTPEQAEQALRGAALPSCRAVVQEAVRREAQRRLRARSRRAWLPAAAASILSISLIAWWFARAPGPSDYSLGQEQRSEAAGWVKGLASEDSAERERASAALLRLGPSAIPALEAAAASANPEVALRAKAILGEIRGPIMFAALEERIRKARTLRATFTGAWTDPSGQSTPFTGTLEVAGGNKVRLSIDATILEKPARLRVISDGSKVWIDFPRRGRDQSLIPAPGSLREDVLSAFLRGGAFFGTKVMLETDTYRKGDRTGVRFVDHLRLKERTTALDESTLKYTATYRLPAGEGSLESTLSYRSGDVRLHRRTLTSQGDVLGNAPGTFRETYDEFTLDSELDDALFRVPESPK
jgi:outer membrane lipoprotein-sorting protein